MRGVNDQITKLNLKHRVKIDFPKLTVERIKELRKNFRVKGPDFIDKQVSAKKQLEMKRIPASNVSFNFSGPILFKITKNQVFLPLSAGVFKQKIRRSEIIKPVKQVELLHHKVQDLSKLHPDTNLLHAPCPVEPLEVNWVHVSMSFFGMKITRKTGRRKSFQAI